MTQILQCRAVERPAGPHKDRRRERETQPLPISELEGRNHRHCDDGSGEDDSADDTVAQVFQLPVFPLGSSSRFLFGLFLRKFSGVPRCHDCVDQLLRVDVRRRLHMRLLGRIVHARVNAIKFVQLALNTVCARRTRHPADGDIKGEKLLLRHPLSSLGV